MDIKAWNEINGEINESKLQAFLESSTDSYAILQLKDADETSPELFMGYRWLERQGKQPEFDHYEVVYTGSLPPDTGPEDLFVKFNIDHPADFTGHSLSVSDIVALKRDGVITCHYTGIIGFRQLDNFLPENYLKNAEMAMEDDYGMIDGIINNGKRESEDRPSVVEKLNVGEPPAHIKKQPRHPSERSRE